MKKLIIIFVVLIFSCERKREMPFIIVDKYIVKHSNKLFFGYAYQDATNKIYYFTDKNIYNIGDTIK